MTDDGRIVWRPLAALWILLSALNAGHEMTRSAASPLLLLLLKGGMGLLTLGLSAWALYTLWHRPRLPFLGISVLACVCTFAQLATRQFGKLTAGIPVSPFDWGLAILMLLLVMLMAALVLHPKGVRPLIRSALFKA